MFLWIIGRTDIRVLELPADDTGCEFESQGTATLLRSSSG